MRSYSCIILPTSFAGLQCSGLSGGGCGCGCGCSPLSTSLAQCLGSVGSRPAFSLGAASLLPRNPHTSVRVHPSVSRPSGDPVRDEILRDIPARASREHIFSSCCDISPSFSRNFRRAHTTCNTCTFSELEAVSFGSSGTRGRKQVLYEFECPIRSSFRNVWIVQAAPVL